MASHYAAVGFTADNIEELERQVMFAAAAATQIASGSESGYANWEDTSGAALWIQVVDGAIVGAQPFYSAAARHEVRIEAMMPDPEHELDGGARVLISNTKTTLRVDILNFALVERGLRGRGPLTIRLVAFAENIAFYQTEAEYASAHEEANWHPLRWVVPTDRYPAGDGGTDRATAMVTGFVLEAVKRTNSLTGDSFLHLRVDTAGLTLDVVTAAASLPAPGAIVHGHFWLSAVAQPAEPGGLVRLR